MGCETEVSRDERYASYSCRMSSAAASSVSSQPKASRSHHGVERRPGKYTSGDWSPEWSSTSPAAVIRSPSSIRATSRRSVPVRSTQAASSAGPWVIHRSSIDFPLSLLVPRRGGDGGCEERRQPFQA